MTQALNSPGPASGPFGLGSIPDIGSFGLDMTGLGAGSAVGDIGSPSSNAQATIGGGIISGGGAYSIPPGFFNNPGASSPAYLSGFPSLGIETNNLAPYLILGGLALGALYFLLRR